MPLFKRLLHAIAAFGAMAAAQQTYTNPVVATEDAPDPGVVYCPESGLYLSTTTTGGVPAFRLRTSPNLVNWTDIGYMFQKKFSWAGTDGYWAPEVHQVNGGYVAYYVARNAATGTLSVGAAVSTSGKCTGPFEDIGQPLVTDTTSAKMGQIDPTYFADVDGRQWLIWKTDGNAVGQPTPIRIAQLTDNGTALVPGQGDWRNTQLITSDLDWEHGVTEGAWVVRYSNAYYLFYSGSGYYDGSYSVGVARAPAITGPYTKLGPPILHNATGGRPITFEGPGHCSVLQDTVDGSWQMVYHAWRGTDRSFRVMLVDQVQWTVGVNGTVWPTVGAGGDGWPSDSPQPMP